MRVLQPQDSLAPHITRALKTSRVNKPLSTSLSGEFQDPTNDVLHLVCEMDVQKDVSEGANTPQSGSHPVTSSPRKRKAGPLGLDLSLADTPGHGSFVLGKAYGQMDSDAEKRRKVTSMDGPNVSPRSGATIVDILDAKKGPCLETGASEITSDKDDKMMHPALAQVYTSPMGKDDKSPPLSSDSGSEKSSPPRLSPKDIAEDVEPVGELNGPTQENKGSGILVPIYTNDDDAHLAPAPWHAAPRHDSMEPLEERSAYEIRSSHDVAPGLSQAEILENYREFEKAKLKNKDKANEHDDDFADIFTEEDGAED